MVRRVSLRPRNAFQYTFAWTVMVMLFSVWCGLGATIHHGISPDLPQVSNAVWMPRASRENAILLAVMRDGKIFCGSNQVSAEQLENCIRQQVSRGSERKAYIRADARVPYGRVEAALDGIRAAGVRDIAFFVEERKNTLTR
jgi:biopolymer transport protein ExbD